MTTNFTLAEQIECVKREISMRQRVYLNWVANRKMTQGKADYELSCMRAVLQTLNRLHEVKKDDAYF